MFLVALGSLFKNKTRHWNTQEYTKLIFETRDPTRGPNIEVIDTVLCRWLIRRFFRVPTPASKVLNSAILITWIWSPVWKLAGPTRHVASTCLVMALNLAVCSVPVSTSNMWAFSW